MVPASATPDSTFLRFWRNVAFGECWEWSGALARGYGCFWYAGKPRKAHRLAYAWLIGDIPVGLQLDHLCRNRKCVNPGHLEPVSQRENILRGESWAAQNARKTRCPRGHPYDARSFSGARFCTTCSPTPEIKIMERIPVTFA